MARLDLFALLRAGIGAMVLTAGPALEAAAATAAPPIPIIVAQADPDAQPDDGQGGTAALLIRIERLEDRLRGLTGQVEQLQFQNKKLDDQLRKMQQDVDFRFQDLGRTPGAAPRPTPLKKSDAGDLGTGTVVSPEPSPATSEPVGMEAPRAAKRVGDAFDPNSNPDAPGAPKPLGTTPPSAPLPTGVIADAASDVTPPTIATPPHAPLDLTPNGLAGAARPVVPAAPTQEAVIAPDPALRDNPAPAGAGSRGEYDDLLSLYKAAQYDAAIEGFQGFVQKYPKDRLIADATYYLGESFARQGRQREAAEQFLKLATDYAKSTHAPDALLHLGVALNALGAKEQACATYEQVSHKYPSASSDVRAGVERELKRAKC